MYAQLGNISFEGLKGFSDLARKRAAEYAEFALINSDPVLQRTSPDRRRRLAHAAPRETLAAWIRTAARLLRPHGTLTVMFRADGLVDLARLLESIFGAVVILPVYPKPDQPAIRILVRATKASRAPLALLPGLVLNDAAGHPTPQAEAVLRAGATLPLAQI